MIISPSDRSVSDLLCRLNICSLKCEHRLLNYLCASFLKCFHYSSCIFRPKNTNLFTYFSRLYNKRPGVSELVFIFYSERWLLFAAHVSWLILSYKEKIYSHQSCNTVTLKHLPLHTTGQFCLHPHLIISPGLRCLSRGGYIGIISTQLIFRWALLLGNCESFVMCYNVQVCIVKQPGSEQLKTHTRMRRHMQIPYKIFLIWIHLYRLIEA